MVRIFRGAQEMKKTAETRMRMMFVLLLLCAFRMILEVGFAVAIFLVEAWKM